MRISLTALVVLLTLPLTVYAQPGAEQAKVGQAHCYLDRGKLTWRIGNEAIERTIRFDKYTGGLRTLGVECTGTAACIVPVAGSEGEFVITGESAPIRLDGDWVY